MKILITNDDGIYAEGMIPLAKWAQKLGDVTIVAPKTEQSAKSHAIELRQAFEVKEIALCPGVRAYSVDSTPADCVRFAHFGLKEHFDLVISGINRGLNVGADIMYSGTVAAAFEAGNLGMTAIALSTPPSYYPEAVKELDAVFAYIREHRLLDTYSMYNINIPENPQGFRLTCQGGPYYSDDFVFQEDGTVLPKGKSVFVPSETMERDTDAVLVGHYISIMPLANTRANLEVLQKLQHLNP